jgi:hypothetical protein
VLATCRGPQRRESHQRSLLRKGWTTTQAGMEERLSTRRTVKTDNKVQRDLKGRDEPSLAMVGGAEPHLHRSGEEMPRTPSSWTGDPSTFFLRRHSQRPSQSQMKIGPPSQLMSYLGRRMKSSLAISPEVGGMAEWRKALLLARQRHVSPPHECAPTAARTSDCTPALPSPALFSLVRGERPSPIPPPSLLGNRHVSPRITFDDNQNRWHGSRDRAKDASASPATPRIGPGIAAGFSPPNVAPVPMLGRESSLLDMTKLMEMSLKFILWRKGL